MAPSMILVLPFLTSACQVRRLRISVPLIEPLLDGQKYFLPDALPAPVGEELRPMFRPRIAQPQAPPRAPRTPNLRTLVRWAQACDSAEQLGERLKRRYDRQLQRRGLARPGGGEQVELDAQLDRLLAD